MIDTGIGTYMGIVIMGAVIVVVTAFLIIKSTSKKGIAQTQEPLLGNMETSTALKKEPAPNLRLRLNSFKSLLRLAPRESSRQRSNAPPDSEPIDEGLAMNRQFSVQLPGVTSSEPAANDAPSSPDQETLNVEPPDEEEPAVTITDTLPAEPAEPAQDRPQEEPEQPDEVSDGEYQEQPDEASDGEYQEQPTKKDTAFDLFTTEIVEENDVSKLAANLSNLDVDDLLEEARNLRNVLRGAGR